MSAAAEWNNDLWNVVVAAERAIVDHLRPRRVPLDDIVVTVFFLVITGNSNYSNYQVITNPDFGLLPPGNYHPQFSKLPLDFPPKSANFSSNALRA